MVQAYEGVPLSLAAKAKKSDAPRAAGHWETMSKISSIAAAVGLIGGAAAIVLHAWAPRLLRLVDRPTLLPGGGRDWIVDVASGTIASKHHPRLALGSLTFDPLSLTHRYTALPEESGLLVLPKETVAALRAGERVPARDLHLVPQLASSVPYGEWDVLLPGATNANVGPRTAATPAAPPSGDGGEDEGLGFVTYVDGNFLMLDDEYALDVSFWKMEEGNTVNFVKASDPDDGDARTLLYGGGRDWVLNDDGTVSPKGHPRLALGRGTRPLCLIDRVAHPANAWTFPEDGLAGLLRGEAMDLLRSTTSDAGIGTRYATDRTYDGWRYVESRVTKAEDAVRVRYVDDNYLALEGRAEEEALVLDVAFWKMEEFNAVNFVGGSRYEARQLLGAS